MGEKDERIRVEESREGAQDQYEVFSEWPLEPLLLVCWGEHVFHLKGTILVNLAQVYKYIWLF
jgi:hypothetical protein